MGSASTAARATSFSAQLEVHWLRCRWRRRRLHRRPAGNCLRLPDEISFEAGAVMTDMVGTQYDAQRRLERLRRPTPSPSSASARWAGPAFSSPRAGARGSSPSTSSRAGSSRPGRSAPTRRSTAGGRPGRAPARADRRPRRRRRHRLLGQSRQRQNAALDAAPVRASGLRWRVAQDGDQSQRPVHPQAADRHRRLVLPDLGVVGDRPLRRRARPSVDKLITHRFPLDDAAEAFRMFDERLTEKAVFVWD